MRTNELSAGFYCTVVHTITVNSRDWRQHHRLNLFALACEICRAVVLSTLNASAFLYIVVVHRLHSAQHCQVHRRRTSHVPADRVSEVLFVLLP